MLGPRPLTGFFSSVCSINFCRNAVLYDAGWGACTAMRFDTGISLIVDALLLFPLFPYADAETLRFTTRIN